MRTHVDRVARTVGGVGAWSMKPMNSIPNANSLIESPRRSNSSPSNMAIGEAFFTILIDRFHETETVCSRHGNWTKVDTDFLFWVSISKTPESIKHIPSRTTPTTQRTPGSFINVIMQAMTMIHRNTPSSLS